MSGVQKSEATLKVLDSNSKLNLKINRRILKMYIKQRNNMMQK